MLSLSRTSWLAVVLAAAAASVVTVPLAADEPVEHGRGLATRKSALTAESAGLGLPPVATPPPLLATLVQTHTDERVLLDGTSPPPERFDALLADRVTGATRPMDARLLTMLRTVVDSFERPDATAEAPRVELVSGFRSPKLNEMLRKKGHHVASHSQHSLGHAVDFRIVLPAAEKGVDPRELEARLRRLGWVGGIGVYTLKDDWFVHVDVGPNRRWWGK